MGSAMHSIIYYRRLAVRESDDVPWRWFDSAIAFPLLHHETACALIEEQCTRAVRQYPLQHIRQIEAPSLAAYDRIDWAGVI